MIFHSIEIISARSRSGYSVFCNSCASNLIISLSLIQLFNKSTPEGCPSREQPSENPTNEVHAAFNPPSFTFTSNASNQNGSDVIRGGKKGHSLPQLMFNLIFMSASLLRD